MVYENRIVCPSRSNVLAKVMDGEAILINVSTGAYYSLNGIGTLVWQWIEKEISLQEMVNGLARDHDVDRKILLADVLKLLGMLEEEGLVRTQSCEAVPEEEDIPGDLSVKLPYQKPILDIYRDMQDLLALDPPMPGLRTIPWEEPEKNQ